VDQKTTNCVEIIRFGYEPYCRSCNGIGSFQVIQLGQHNWEGLMNLEISIIIMMKTINISIWNVNNSPR
jgi:hypothetical protein